MHGSSAYAWIRYYSGDCGVLDFDFRIANSFGTFWVEGPGTMSGTQDSCGSAFQESFVYANTYALAVRVTHPTGSRFVFSLDTSLPDPYDDPYC